MSFPTPRPRGLAGLAVVLALVGTAAALEVELDAPDRGVPLGSSVELRIVLDHPGDETLGLGDRLRTLTGMELRRQGGGTATVPTGFSLGRSYPDTLPPHSRFEITIDLATVFPELRRPGRFALSWDLGDRQLDVPIVITPEYRPDRRHAVELATKFGTIVVQLDAGLAPRHVENFVSLAREGFYDGTLFHRVIADDLVQAGDRTLEGTGNSGRFLELETSPGQSHRRGAVAMVRGRDLASASSQFFILLRDHPEYDGRFTVFGEVVSGLEVVERISQLPATSKFQTPAFAPYKPPVILKATVRELPEERAPGAGD